MLEQKTVSVFVFRIDNGQYYFYLVKRGPNIPYHPSTWTNIASIISEKDVELYEKLQKKYGDLSEYMLEKVIILRLLLERNLIIDPEINVSLSASLDIRQQILEMDQIYLNVLFHSMIPSGHRRLLMDERYILPRYFLFASPASGSRKNTKLFQYTDYLTGRHKVPEEKGRWFKPSEIIHKRETLKELFDNATATLMHYFYTEKKKLVETAREIENKKSQLSMFSKGLLPFLWRFKTPAHTRKPYTESNIYVIGNQKKFIIDPGSTIKNNLDFLTEFVDANLDTIEGILLTNPLADHVNQAMFFKEKYNLPIYTSKITAEALNAEAENFVFTSYLYHGNKIQLGSYEPLGIKKWEMEVIELPGYTAGQIGFYDPRGIVFVSSLFHKYMISLIDSYPGAYSDLMKSYNRVSKLKARYAFSGHRDFIINPRKMIAFNLKQFSTYEPVIIEQLKNGKSSLEAITKEVQERAKYKWEVLARNVAIVVLAKLAEQEKVNKIGEDYFWLKNTTK